MLVWFWVSSPLPLSPFPALLVEHGGIPRITQRQNLLRMSWVSRNISFQLDMCKTPHLWGVRCPNHLIWYLSMTMSPKPSLLTKRFLHHASCFVANDWLVVDISARGCLGKPLMYLPPPHLSIKSTNHSHCITSIFFTHHCFLSLAIYALWLPLRCWSLLVLMPFREGKKQLKRKTLSAVVVRLQPCQWVTTFSLI